MKNLVAAAMHTTGCTVTGGHTQSLPGAFDEAPFYGAPIYPGDIGTKGGLVIDHDGRVLTSRAR